MRFMLKAILDTEKANAAAKAGNLGKTIQSIVTDHSSYDYASIVDKSKLVIDTRNATKGIQSPKIVHC